MSAHAPAGTIVYAIGDIHGRLDLLRLLHGMIQDDVAESRSRDRLLVYLGDYVDRGPDSAGVIELLSGGSLAGFAAVHLLGNHEEFLLRFLDGTSTGADWLFNGGVEALQSYGIDAHLHDMDDPMALGRLRQALARQLPARHLAFLQSLMLSHAAGDYLFVHAGIRPGVPLELQARADLLWIRSLFLDSTVDHGKMVVHGHTIADEPEVRPNRIGIDTGAFATGRLTCLVLEGADRRFLRT
jgi:serine/threonine protein phosphatase 1